MRFSVIVPTRPLSNLNIPEIYLFHKSLRVHHTNEYLRNKTQKSLKGCLRSAQIFNAATQPHLSYFFKDSHALRPLDCACL